VKQRKRDERDVGKRYTHTPQSNQTLALIVQSGNLQEKQKNLPKLP
jgi:hypothetical protein